MSGATGDWSGLLAILTMPAVKASPHSRARCEAVAALYAILTRSQRHRFVDAPANPDSARQSIHPESPPFRNRGMHGFLPAGTVGPRQTTWRISQAQPRNLRAEGIRFDYTSYRKLMGP